MVKMCYRVFTPDILISLHITDVLFVLGVLGMIMGSIKALKETHIKRMIAYSSVAQIGYIFMGIGLGTKVGIMAACFHILAHAFTKPMLFLSANGLVDVSNHHVRNESSARFRKEGYRIGHWIYGRRFVYDRYSSLCRICT